MPSIANTVAGALARAQAQGLARIDAQLLLLHLLDHEDVGRAWLIAHGEYALSPALVERYAALCGRRALGEPVAYLTGHKPFYGLELQIDARVLDPRPDTETLVDWALELLAGHKAPQVLDLGTGSGAIALAIAHARPDAAVSAVDANADALALARANAERLRLPVDFRLSDWLASVHGHYQLIVSNPPYIAEGDPHLPSLRHEPLSALVAGSDGLSDLRRIVDAAPQHLAPGGWLLLEHGCDQAEAVRNLLHQAGFAAMQTRNDLAGIGRCTGARLPRVK